MIVNIVDVPGGQKRYLHIIFTKSVQKKLNNNNIFFFLNHRNECTTFCVPGIPMPHLLQSSCGMQHMLHHFWCLIPEY